jgi:predicted nuclease of predicted toxin-antitoxin system
VKFLLDECVGLEVQEYLRNENHDVINAAIEYSGSLDRNILFHSVSENRILITNDKDFGELIFKDGSNHTGVILLRLLDERGKNKVRCLKYLLHELGDELISKFVVSPIKEHKFNIEFVYERHPFNRTNI